MMSETRPAWLVHRAVGGAQAATVEDVVHWGTRGGARMPGLDAVGTLEVGMAADLAVYELSHPRYFGQFQPALAPVLGGGAPVMRSVLAGGAWWRERCDPLARHASAAYQCGERRGVVAGCLSGVRARVLFSRIINRFDPYSG
ncbi:amidohydrolase family protein [Acidihalobacter ferrooxydans]|uniref:Amidohydrolase-related domain-containing protein n=1 Tax=Acidihalobacter ferrooxydans TaxID=1765967 RepID=A0A1P8UGK4_9GAMM|nr:amidohydrolase family protein [Acidihalobacter ferrooxydans]APZ42940.1 hypothetical protein BW247_07415 [Acidihalobacter ferrooxydans]